MTSPVQPVNANNADIPLYGVVAERYALRDVLENIRHHRITLVSAPPGYGKTTAIAHFVRETTLPTAWHSLQERERDLPVLFWHSLQALEFIAPGISIAAGNLTSPDECAAYIASYLREHLTQHTIYVMDDLHYIAAAPQVERWLRELVRQLPPTCHLVLISRALPDLPLAELIARGDVLAIGQEQLRFTPEEAGRLAKKIGVDLTPDVLETRVQQLEGWPVGVAMSLRPLPADLQIGILRGSGGPEALFDALAAGILKSLSPVLNDFLLGASVFGRVTPQICSEILGLPQSGALMADILRRNLFVSQVSGGLTLHRLFRNFLQRRLQQIDQNRFARLHTLAAEWHSRENEDDEAFHHYLAAGNIDAVLDIVRRTHNAYYQQGNIEALLRWRAQLGEHAAQLPKFVYTCAMILTDRYLYTDAMQELDLAEAGFRVENDIAGITEVSLQRAQIHIWRGDYATARALAEPLSLDTTLKPTSVGRAKHQLALIEMATGDMNIAIAHLEQILPLYESTNDTYYTANVIQDMAIAYAGVGNMTAASHCLQRLVAIRRTLGQPNALSMALNNLGYHYHQIGDYDLALNTFEEGVSIVSQTNNHRAEGYLRWSMGDLLRDLGGDDAALRLYESAYELSSGTEPVLQQSVALSMAALYRWRGDYPLASWMVREVAEELPRSGMKGSALDMVAHASGLVIAFSADRTPIDGSAFDSILDNLADKSVSSEYIQILLLAAHYALQIGDERTAASYLRRCVPPCQQGIARHVIAAEILNSPLLWPFVERRPDFAPLTTAVRRLAAARTAHTASTARITETPAAAPETTYSLRVFTLGDESIERDGVPVTTAEWRSSRAKEFFLYLLFEGPASREVLSLIFWPDSSSSRVRSNFHTTLYRARRALGENVILYENDIYRINPSVSVWCDALVFQRYVREAQALSYSDVRADDLYHKASSYYRGEFLPTLDAEWMISYREEYLRAAHHGADWRRTLLAFAAGFRHGHQIIPARAENRPLPRRGLSRNFHLLRGHGRTQPRAETVQRHGLYLRNRTRHPALA